MKLAIAGGWEQYLAPLRAREPFSTDGTLSGRRENGDGPCGSLRPDWIESRRTADYVVYAGRTPIAWHTSAPPPGQSVPGGWVIPDTPLTPAAARHQSRITVVITALRHGA